METHNGEIIIKYKASFYKFILLPLSVMTILLTVLLISQGRNPNSIVYTLGAFIAPFLWWALFVCTLWAYTFRIVIRPNGRITVRKWIFTQDFNISDISNVRNAYIDSEGKPSWKVDIEIGNYKFSSDNMMDNHKIFLNYIKENVPSNKCSIG